MIVRQLARRQARSPPASLRQCKRFFASETNLDSDLDFAHQVQVSVPTRPEALVDDGVDRRSAKEKMRELERRRKAAAEDPTVAIDWEAKKHLKSVISNVGFDRAPFYQPHKLVTSPPRPSDVTLELLLASQAHIGHSTSVWNPANARYIFGIRQGIHIISLDVIAAHLRRAAKVVSEVTRRGGTVLFVGTRAGQDRSVVRAAQLAQGCHIFDKWIPGSLTNRHQLLNKCPTKLVNEFDQEVPGYEDQLTKMPALMPDLVVTLTVRDHYILLRECGQNHIPTIGIVDTDADPTWVTYPIPANDDSLRCTNVIAGVLGRAGQEGHQRRAAAAREGLVTYTSTVNLTPIERSQEEDRDALYKVAAADPQQPGPQPSLSAAGLPQPEATVGPGPPESSPADGQKPGEGFLGFERGDLT
ncbi:mitochondrial 37S ribosomal protein uS2m [Phyllosticta citriasiana]|uniref:mitochondrial 37S ribosomal protein uS2m n=1 Tax=Phyllosticta citriasiana TaxID=595635 RepID=UPI0030FD8075